MFVRLTCCLLVVLTGCTLGATEGNSVPVVTVLPTVTTVPTLAPTATEQPISTHTPIPTATEQQQASGRQRDGVERLYVYQSPSTMAQISKIIIGGAAEFPLSGRTDDNIWLETTDADWIRFADVVTDYDITQLPIIGTSENIPFVGHVAPDSDGLRLREGPYLQSQIIRVLEALTPLQVQGRLAENEWLYVRLADGQLGWVNTEFTDIPFNLNDVAVIPAPALIQVTAPVPAPQRTTAAPTDVAVAVAPSPGPPAENTSPQAEVMASAGGLRLRQMPSIDSTILFNLRAGTPLELNGRTVNNDWVLVVIPEGYTGWVASAYVHMFQDINTVPLIENPEPAPYFEIAPPENAPNVVSGVGGGARNIFLHGQTLGNHPGVFSTVGDSLTDTPYFLREFTYAYNLRDYGYLLPAFQFFSAETALSGRTSKAARASWSSFSVLDPSSADGDCNPGEIPLVCEYRLFKPSVALIMIGTNDAPAFTTEQFNANLTRIVEISIDMGVIPVLSTLPPRAEFNDKVLQYNEQIRALTRVYDIPLWDFYAAVSVLPNSGLHPDGVHLSIPPNAPASTTDFTAENLQFGTTMRNLTALQILDTIWRNVLY